MRPLKVAVVFYDNFAPLDVYGPMQAMNVSFGLLADDTADETKPLFEHYNVCKEIGMVKTGLNNDGPEVLCCYDFSNLPPVDIVLIPGGMGSRVIIDDTSFISELKTLVYKTPIVLSVCTGAALLAQTGFLDGKMATSNKSEIPWKWVKRKGKSVKWDYAPRWIGEVDKTTQTGYMTSAGVAAGIDMMLALINELFGPKIVTNTQNKMEYTWNSHPAIDPFTKLCPKCKPKNS